MAHQKQFSDLTKQIQQDLAKENSLKYNIITFDALGCGESDKPIDPILFGDSFYTTENLLLDAAAVLEFAGTENTVIISHSFGTTLAARLVQTPVGAKKIKSVVLMGTALTVPDGGHPIFKLPVFVLQWIQPQLSEGFIKVAFSPKTSKELKDKILSQSNHNDMKVCRSFYRNFKWAKESDWLALRPLPLLILHGEDDLLTPIAGAQALFDTHFHGIDTHFHGNSHDQVNDSTNDSTGTNNTSTSNKTNNKTFVIVPDAGHQLMQEKPEACSEAIVTFLKQTTQTFSIYPL